MKNTLKWFYYILLIIPCFEIALLILGYRSYQSVDYSISSTPSYCLLPHNELGFCLKPGGYDVTINQHLNYSVSHGLDSTRKINYSANDSTGKKIYFFGCSYTYGMGVNDDENFPALIQKQFPQTKIKNFAVPGYGSVQSFLQLKKLIRNSTIPDIVIINYADFHDIRNALSPQYRLNLKMGYENSNDSIKKIMTASQVPFIHKKENQFTLSFCKWDKIYTNWNFRSSLASVNYFQTFTDRQAEKSTPKEVITLFLFNEIRNICEVNDIQLLITGITQNNKTKSTLKKLSQKGFNTLDISINLESNEYNNAPYDSHPNKLAHSLFADKLTNYLTPFIIK